MSEKALLFMPDISGYTEFINQTDVDHSGHIISELLELILENNTLGLTLAEVEGDALFMYSLKEDWSLSEIKAQVKKMFLAFHEHLLLYKHQRICDCGACSSANRLTLKFIVHIANIDFIEVAGNRKPYGPEIIKLHRLLKNDVPSNEYLLFSQDSVNALQIDTTKENAQSYETQYDFGNSKYLAIDIGKYKSEVSSIPSFPITKAKSKILNFAIEIDVPIEDLYEIMSNFAYRSLWSAGVDRIEFDSNKINRGGAQHRCVVNGNLFDVETMKVGDGKKPLIYSERTKSAPFTEQIDNFFVFTESTEGTKIEASIYVTFKKYRGWLKFLLKLTLKKNIQLNFKQLKDLAEQKGLEQIYKETYLTT
ncbi:MAG: DUF2652 domain-containing protein [Flavobacteriales bacterium]|nr:DUF2652 domain-containing protein [Flavobacteriales bacterium]